MKPDHTFFRLWGMPILLGIASLAGLLLALIGDGLWHILSWLLMSISIGIITYFLGKASFRSKTE